MTRITQPKTVINSSFATVFKGAYDAETLYIKGDTVTSGGSTYVCIEPSTGNDPTDTQYWAIIAQKGDAGAISVIPLTNIVKNGNFNGTTEWTAQNSTNSASGNVLSNTANGASIISAVYQNTAIDSIVGKKVYVRAKIRVTNSSCVRFTLIVDGSTAGANQESAIQTPVLNQWYDISFVAVQPADVVGKVCIKSYHEYESAATASGKVMEIKDVLAIDLPSVFGAGQEPSKEEMDDVIALYENEWFDGTTDLGIVDYLTIQNKYLQAINVGSLTDVTGVVAGDGTNIRAATAADGDALPVTGGTLSSQLTQMTNIIKNNTALLPLSNIYSTYYISSGGFVSSLGVSNVQFVVKEYAVEVGKTYNLYGIARLSGAYPIAGFKTTSGTGGTCTILLSATGSNQNFNLFYTPSQSGYIFIAIVTTSYTELMICNTAVVGSQAQIKGKNLAVLGDSIISLMRTGTYTTQAQLDAQNWPALNLVLGVATLMNLALGGATVQDRGAYDTDEPQPDSNSAYLTNEVRWLIRQVDENGKPEPDCIVIWLGTNSSTAWTPDNFDTVMAMSYEDLMAAGGAATRQTFYGGLRAALEMLYREYQFATIMIFSPIQAYLGDANRTYANMSGVTDALKKMANRYSCVFVDAFHEIGIVDQFETNAGGGADRYLSDGLHPNDEGKVLITNYAANRIMTGYFAKK